MPDETAFEGTAFLGLARASRRDPYRLSLFARHLDVDERPLALLPIHGGDLLVTDRRIVAFRAHLDDHGPWNVKHFSGYAVERSVPRDAVTGLERQVGPSERPRPGYREVEDRLVLTTAQGEEAFIVSRGPEPVLTQDDVVALRAAILGPQAK